MLLIKLQVERIIYRMGWLKRRFKCRNIFLATVLSHENTLTNTLGDDPAHISPQRFLRD